MKWKKLIYYVAPLLGFMFCLWYIFTATCSIVYSDYIRIVLNYLPDVWSADKFFCPDVLTRIPITYLARLVNVEVFHYSTMFDMVLGVIGLGLSGLVLGRYCDERQVGVPCFLFLMFLVFGLNKWEMLTNGTGWVHFLAFACFYYHYLVFDRVLYGTAGRWDRVLLLALPPVITLGIAGPYCAVYTVVIVLAYASVWAVGVYQQKKYGKARSFMDQRTCLAGIASAVVPLLLYMWSNSYAVMEYDGAIEIGLFEMAGHDPKFLVKFLVRAMASMVVGEETINELMESGAITMRVQYLMGLMLGAGYFLALFLNMRCRLYEKTLVPLMLLFAGMGNHAIILVSRFIFARTSYGMSSRYALQYQAGLLGIILTFALAWGLAGGLRAVEKGMALAFCLAILWGHAYTDYRELQKAPYRRAYGERIVAAALDYESLSDDVLRETFDYRENKPGSAGDVRRALGILKDNHWNVFYGRTD